MREDMTIEELVEGMYEDAVRISAEYFPTDEEINALWRRNAVRLASIGGMIDGRDGEVLGYLSGLGKGELTELLEIIGNEDDEDPNWTEACRKLAEGIAGILDAKQERKHRI